MDREGYAALSLMDFIPALSPQLRQPLHMQRFCDIFERIAKGETVRALCTYPIRHYKTETMLHAIVWLLCKDPGLNFVLMTYDHKRAETLGKKCIWLADRAGVGGERGAKTIRQWFNKWGGGVHVMSADQSSEGADCHILLFDDPLSEDGARNPMQRDAVDESINYYTMRCVRNGKRGSVVGVMSRWSPDDPVGRRQLRTAVRWEELHQPAIINEGLPTEQAFAPEVLSLSELQAIREEEHENDPTDRNWYARYMGSPIVLGGSKFKETSDRWTELPPWSYRLVYGVDLAFSVSDKADYFALVVGKIMCNKFYILDIQRHKLETHLIESTCKAAMLKYGRGPCYSYVSGPELGTVKLLRERGLPFVPMHARYNKLVRAERTIRRWNDGMIVVPHTAPWLNGFLNRLDMFTGSDKATGDDEIDALVSACDGGMGTALGGVTPRVVGRSYPGFSAR